MPPIKRTSHVRSGTPIHVGPRENLKGRPRPSRAFATIDAFPRSDHRGGLIELTRIA
jgi:hypothetical protein